MAPFLTIPRLTHLQDRPPCDNCEQQKEPCEWVPSSQVCSACAKWNIACMQPDMPSQWKQKSQMFIKSDVEGDWVHQIKRPQVDKGKGQMGTADSEPDDEEAWDRYRVDVHRLVDSSEAITRSFEALVLLLVEWLPMPMSGNLGSRSLDEEGTENVEE